MFEKSTGTCHFFAFSSLKIKPWIRECIRIRIRFQNPGSGSESLVLNEVMCTQMAQLYSSHPEIRPTLPTQAFTLHPHPLNKVRLLSASKEKKHNII